MPAPNHIELRKFIVEGFSRDDLRILCSDYFADFHRDHDGRDAALTSLAEDLLVHCERRGQLERLRYAVHATRRKPYEDAFGSFIAAEVVTKPRNPQQIFLSYAHQDEGLAQRLQADLRAQNIPLWVATSSIQLGEKWAAAIDRGLRESGIFAIILTPNTLKSTWVEHELYSAIPAVVDKTMRLLPLYFKSCDFKTKLPSLNAYQYLDFTHGYEAGLQSLLYELGFRLTLPSPIVNPRKLSRRQLVGGSLTIAAGAAVIAARQVITSNPVIPTISPQSPTDKSVTNTALPVQVVAQENTRTPQPTLFVLPTATNTTRTTATTIPPTIAISTATSTPNPKLVITSPFMLEFSRIPAGEFLMGSAETDKEAFDDEKPQHRLFLPEYYIAKTPVTVAQFEVFVKDLGYKTLAEKEGKGIVWDGKQWVWAEGVDWRHPLSKSSDISKKAQHPVTQVSYYDAVAFCEWLSQKTGQQIRLPSEAEWEKAARGNEGRLYAWGNQAIDNTRCNYNGAVGDTTEVGKYSPLGDTPLTGLQDMTGNVWEWTRSRFGDWRNSKAELKYAYPYNANDGREDLGKLDNNIDLIVYKGGAWRNAQNVLRCACRSDGNPDSRSDFGGFRVVRGVAPVS